MVTLPRETYSATGVNFDAYLISAAADKPEAAWEWITFLSHQFHDRQAPARRSLVESEAFREQVGSEAAEVVRASLEMDIVRLNGVVSAEFFSRSGFHGVYPQALYRIYSGE